MSTAAQPRQLWWRLLGWSFLLGALLDLAFGCAALAAQDSAAEWLGLRLPPPDRRVYVDLAGLLLIGLGAVYMQIFRRPQRLAPVAAVTTLLRFGGFALFYSDVLFGRADRFFLTVGAAEGLLGLAQLLLLRLAAGSLVTALRAQDAAG